MSANYQTFFVVIAQKSEREKRFLALWMTSLLNMLLNI